MGLYIVVRKEISVFARDMEWDGKHLNLEYSVFNTADEAKAFLEKQYAEDLEEIKEYRDEDSFKENKKEDGTYYMQVNCDEDIKISYTTYLYSTTRSTCYLVLEKSYTYNSNESCNAATIASNAYSNVTLFTNKKEAKKYLFKIYKHEREMYINDHYYIAQTNSRRVALKAAGNPSRYVENSFSLWYMFEGIDCDSSAWIEKVDIDSCK